MLDNPNIPTEIISTCLQSAYDLHAVEIDFLPLGADLNTVVYRVTNQDGTVYFLKLRSGVFDETSVTLPLYLYQQGVSQIIAPLPTRSGQPWAHLDAYRVILYPFIEGQDGYAIPLTTQQWYTFGSTLHQIHTMYLPAELTSSLRRETFSPYWCDILKDFLANPQTKPGRDPVAMEVSALLQTRQEEISALIELCEEHARALAAQPPPFVLCHTDLHAGNLHITKDGSIYIVDWDAPLLAPKERDLMYIGGAQGFTGVTPLEEETLFYSGYGQTQINNAALAYYRFARIIEDIGIYCQELLLSTNGGEDRAQSLRYLKSNFLPGGTIAMAYRAESPT
ncbi:MAG: phosphotransferase [Chloroflexi bacterium HGW-Chloroflexi-10]|nr:MAG: phosphotransferase [Chloroflexi bacterium HGW-Chloroflexi-10]